MNGCSQKRRDSAMSGNNEIVKELRRTLERINEYCDKMVVWGNADRERWNYVSVLARDGLRTAKGY